MFRINHQISLAEGEFQLTAIRAQGAGGQNVNKVATAIHLRFDIYASSLTEPLKNRLLASHDSRITKDGIIVIKSQSTRSQEKNKQLALERLREMILDATKIRKKRVPTKPSRASQKRRLDTKNQQGKRKILRRKANVRSE